jgi:uncharacterized protein (DUF58 family)
MMLQLRAFEPEFLERLDRLILGVTRARTIRAGRRNIGRVQGGGIELENFREYAEGDDLRFLDWNAFARLDDLTIRTFRAERQIEVTILIDASASMGIPERDEKLGLALLLGAGLAYIVMGENDPVRLAAFTYIGGRFQLEATPFYQRRESFGQFRRFVTSLKSAGATRLDEAISSLLNERRNRGIVIVISDFLVDSAQYESALGRLTNAHHEVKVVHVMGRRETTGDYPPGAYRIRDSETGEVREITFGPAVAQACRVRAARHAGQLAKFCTRSGIALAQAFDARRVDEIVLREFPKLGVIS